MKKIFLTLISATMVFASMAQTEVTPFTPGLTSEGIAYFLPQTRLHITIEMERTTLTPGEYAPYASHCLRISDAPLQREEHWKLLSVKVTPYGVPDPTRAYSIRFKQKTLAPLVTLTSDGRLLSVNAEAEQPAALSQPSAVTMAGETVNPADYKTPEILAATSIRKAAELAAAEIYDIRENRALLNKGQADYMPKDGEQLKQMLDGLKEQENGLLQLFRGTQSVTHIIATMEVNPGDFSGQPLILFRFSEDWGLSNADDLSGQAYTLSLTDEHTLPAESPNAKPAKQTDDLRYCVTGNARTEITAPDGTTLYSLSLPYSQLGRVERLGGDLFNKKTTTRLFLSPIHGNIEKLEE